MCPHKPSFLISVSLAFCFLELSFSHDVSICKSSLPHGTVMAYKFSLSKNFRSRFSGSTPDKQRKQLSLLNIYPHMDDILNFQQGQPVTRKCFPAVLLTSLSSSWCCFYRLARFSGLETCMTWRKAGCAFNCISHPFPDLMSSLTIWQPSSFPLSKSLITATQGQARLCLGGMSELISLSQRRDRHRILYRS